MGLGPHRLSLTYKGNIGNEYRKKLQDKTKELADTYKPDLNKPDPNKPDANKPDGATSNGGGVNYKDIIDQNIEKAGKTFFG